MQPTKSITPSQAVINSLIRKVEDTITELTIKREEIATPLEEANQAYYKIKAEDEKLADQIKLENDALQLLIHLKTGKPLKDVKVFRSLSNSSGVQKAKERRTKTPWGKCFEEILTARKKFLTISELYEAALVLHPGWELKDDKEKRKLLVYHYKNKIERGEMKVFAMFAGKIGLRYWMNGNEPKEIYSK